jgi:hypothetical protein
MKKIILLFLASNFVLAYSQDWSAILTNSVSYFSTDSTFIHAVRIDSTSGSGDTLTYFPFKMLRQGSQGTTYNISGDNWIGGHISTLPDGYNIFYNRKHNPVLLNTRAILNETWVAYRYPDSSFIEAKIDSLGISQFLGQTDSIKSISFQLKDKNGNHVINQSDSCLYINTTKLVLSKNYGLIKIVDFYKFPVSNLSDLNDIYGSDYQYNLIGLTNPAIGYKKPTLKDFYDFNIGDEIDWTGYYYSKNYDYQWTQTYSEHWTESEFKDVVISKLIASNDSSVEYTFNRNVRTRSSDDSNYEYETSTPSKTYYFYNYYFWNNPENFEPLEARNCFFHNTLSVTKYHDETHPIYKEVYYKNAGYYYFEHYRGGHYLMDYFENHFTLQYYTHGNYSWGTPFEFAPSQVITPDANSDTPVFYPNPVNNRLYFRFQNPNTYDAIITICNMHGVQVLNKHLYSNMLDVSNLSPGFYTIRIVQSVNVQIKTFTKL